MEKYYQTLINPQSSIDQKYISIFELKQIQSSQAVDCLKNAIKILKQHNPISVLLLHEIAYALGQIPQTFSAQLDQFLVEIIEDDRNHPIVRHEAAEALVNLAPESHQNLYIKYQQQQEKQSGTEDNEEILADTCKLALKKSQTYSKLKNSYALKYNETREPAPAFTEEELNLNFDVVNFKGLSEEQQIKLMINYIKDEKYHIFDKYRVLYYIRDNSKPLFIIEMTKLLEMKSISSLMKHEISFILGQLGSLCPLDILPILMNVSLDKEFPSIARHETIAAFQTIISDQQECQVFLEKLIDDPDQIVKETAIVSLKLSQFWN